MTEETGNFSPLLSKHILIHLCENKNIHCNFWSDQDENSILVIHYKKNITWFTVLRDKPIKLVISCASNLKKNEFKDTKSVILYPFTTIKFIDKFDEYGELRSIKFDFYDLKILNSKPISRDCLSFEFKLPNEQISINFSVIDEDFSDQIYIHDEFSFYYYDPKHFEGK